VGRDAATVMERCDVLGACSEEPDRLTRPFASAAMRQAHEHVTSWMRKAGMAVSKDNVGNLRGRYEGGADADTTLLVGSHLDSVPDAGRYDGPLGVMVALAAVQRLHDSRSRLPYAIEVVGFADEEGLRYGTTYLGSRALAGVFDVADLKRADVDGVTMAEAIRAFGGDPTRLADDRWAGGKLLGYIEVHIEQGPVLESLGLPVGVVSAIAGQSRFEITFIGQAGHAGTVPMDRRRDALVAASTVVVGVETLALTDDQMVATVGKLYVEPGAANVIPGRASFTLDVRHPSDVNRSKACEAMLALARETAEHRKLTVEVRPVSERASVACSPRMIARLRQAIGDRAVDIPSGAGHDAVYMSELTDVAMLFVRCKGGVSHNPAESVTEADVAEAIDVLSRFLELLAADQ
jgi:allantoate deiminase